MEEGDSIKLFSKRVPSGGGNILCQTARTPDAGADVFGFAPKSAALEMGLYDGLRHAVPLIDAAIQKIVRLTGGFSVRASDESVQGELESFVGGVRAGISGTSLQSFLDVYLDSLLTYGAAVGEILIDPETLLPVGLFNGHIRDIDVRAGKSPVEPEFFRRDKDGNAFRLPHPERILFTALNPSPENPCGKSVLKGLPYLSAILMRVYECIGQNFDRVGSVRYAVTYKPQDSADRAYAKERAQQIADEWSGGMQAARFGQIRDFVAVGDVDIKVIGADCPILETEIPVKQLLEQIVAKLSIPPFLLGLSWSSTERMSSQQADILTSELEFYRRLLTPVIQKICESFLRLSGSASGVAVEWNHINLQDEAELADARLKNAQAREIEARLAPSET